MKKIIFLILILGLTFLLGLFFKPNALVFRSLESITANGQPVFNRIQFIPGWKQDIWLMQQSHSGLETSFDTWDRLAIIVDKQKKPYLSKFYQLRPGRLKLPSPSDTIPFKVRCFACHANGPRALRPNLNTAIPNLSWLQRLQIELWNVRMKTYGHVNSITGQEKQAGAQFRSNYPIFHQPLKLKGCALCHSENGIRNALQLEHAGTAHFLLQKGLMPPFPFKADPRDIEILTQLMKKK